MTIDDLLAKSGMLSAAPQVASKLNRLLKKSAFIDEIVEVVQYDPGLTARILKTCNSPMYRGRNGISSLEEAISRLGNETISRIVWQVSMSNQMGGSLPAYGMEAGSLWRHSMTTAIASEELWKLSVFQEDIGTAFTAGLLHDVGKILTNTAIAPQGAVFRRHLEEEKMLVQDAETALLGFNHADVGGQLLLKWGQSEELVSAVTHHHDPEKAENRRFASLTALANQCARRHQAMLEKKIEIIESELPPELLETLQISSSGLEKAMAAIQKRAEEVEVLVAFM